MSLLSPGVEIQEIDASVIVPTVSNSVACFSGNFVKGPVESYLLVSNEDELVEYYGKPTKLNYNDWMQCSSFLQYGNQLLISRASNYNGSMDPISGLIVTADVTDDTTVPVSDASLVQVGDFVAFGDANGPIAVRYLVTATDTGGSTITIDRNTTIDTAVNNTVYSIEVSDNAVYEAVQVGGTDVLNNDYIADQMPILNYSDYELKETSIVFTSSEAKLKFIARNPGNWGNDIEIGIAKPADFGVGNDIFDGIALDDLYEYFPTGNEVGIVIKYDGLIKEVFTVSFDETAVNDSNKSIYIEHVINRTSSYVFVKDNTTNTNDIDSYIFGTTLSPGRGSFTLVNGLDSSIQQDDLMRGYTVWANKEEIDQLGLLAA